MINQVRIAVMEILNKDNRGYLSPDQFNSLAELAQMERFEEYFSEFSENENKLFRRIESERTANSSEQREHIIKRFEITRFLSKNPLDNKFPLPGTGIGPVATFPRVYKIQNIFGTKGDVNIIAAEDGRRILRIPRLNPTPSSYIGWLDEGGLFVHPQPLEKNLYIDYIRFPKPPKWTYTMIGDNPLFNPSSTTYQDFELPESDITALTMKILQYSGILIRESDIVEITQREEVINKQENN